MQRILVIEPELRARHALRSILAEAGYDVVVADGSDAVAIHSSRPADLVIADGADAPPPASFAGARLLAVPGGRRPARWVENALPKPFRRDDLLAAVRATLD